MTDKKKEEKKLKSQPKPFLPIQCPNCGSTAMDIGPTVSVASLKMKPDEPGWLVTGNICLIRCLHGRCCNCGFELDTIRQEIPIRYSSQQCPKCGKSDDFTYEIDELQLEGESYRFSVIIRCQHCAKRLRFSKALRKLWSIAGLRVSAFGIEIEIGNKSA